MQCREKQDLQRACATAWESYEAAVQATGPATDFKGAPIPPSIHEVLVSYIKLGSGMVSGRSEYVTDPKTGESGPAFQGAFRLRTEHLKASHALSKHLSRHRC